MSYNEISSDMIYIITRIRSTDVRFQFALKKKITLSHSLLHVIVVISQSLSLLLFQNVRMVFMVTIVKNDAVFIVKIQTIVTRRRVIAMGVVRQDGRVINVK